MLMALDTSDGTVSKDEITPKTKIWNALLLVKRKQAARGDKSDRPGLWLWLANDCRLVRVE